eukprot:1225028-Rhodomonas_salina.1
MLASREPGRAIGDTSVDPSCANASNTTQGALLSEERAHARRARSEEGFGSRALGQDGRDLAALLGAEAGLEEVGEAVLEGR